MSASVLSPYSTQHPDSFLVELFVKDFTRLIGAEDTDIARNLIPFVEWLTLPGGTCLFKAGVSAGRMFVLLQGRLQAVLEDKVPASVVDEIPRGQLIGELALLTRSAPVFSVYAMRDSQLACISEEALELITGQFPRIAVHLVKGIASRIPRLFESRKISRKAVNIAVVPISTEVDLSAFTHSLIADMQRYANVKLLSAGYINEQMGIAFAQTPMHDQPRHIMLSKWLDEQESTHQHVVYLADATPSERTRRCLRQADEILLVGDFYGSPALSPTETEFLRPGQCLTNVRQRLVLLHPSPDQQPRHTARWLVNRTVSFHHHICPLDARHLARLSRFVRGKAVGLVLSGGGARGLSHVGVYKALLDAGVPVDMVGGTSIGSMVGACIAIHSRYENLYEAARKACLHKPTSDYNLLPFSFLIRGRRLIRAQEELAQGLDIEDLWLPYFCIATDYTAGKEVVLQTGSLERAMRASSALPGLLPPVVFNRHLYVDGGLLNNLPVDVMLRQEAHKIIAVNLDRHTNEPMTIEDFPSAFELAIDQLSGRHKYPVPGLFSLLMNASTISSYQRSQIIDTDIDLNLKPDLRKYGLLDWHRLDKLADIAYQYAKEVLETVDVSSFQQ